MKRYLAGCAALGLVAIAIFPFARDAYNRYTTMQRLAPLLTEQDRIAFRTWNGNAADFAKTLHARCELVHGAGQAICAPYRVALD